MLMHLLFIRSAKDFPNLRALTVPQHPTGRNILHLSILQRNTAIDHYQL